MKQYAKYILFGLIFMAPQEWVVTVYRASIGEFPFHYFYLSFIGWTAMLTIAYGSYSLLGRFVKNEGSRLVLFVPIYMVVALTIEWTLLGNAPWANSGANQLGLIAGWVSMFVIPRLFLEEGVVRLKRWTTVYYVFFAFSVVAPVLIFPDGPIKGVIIYGYTIIPFLILSSIYILYKWRTSHRDPLSNGVAS